MYLIQHYVINFVSALRQVGGFSPGSPVSSTNKTDRNDKAEILLKVELDTITITHDTYWRQRLLLREPRVRHTKLRYRVHRYRGTDNCQKLVLQISIFCICI